MYAQCATFEASEDPIDTPEQILAVVDGYRHRWKIEELFKALLDLAQGFLIAKKCDQS